MNRPTLVTSSCLSQTSRFRRARPPTAARQAPRRARWIMVRASRCRRWPPGWRRALAPGPPRHTERRAGPARSTARDVYLDVFFPVLTSSMSLEDGLPAGPQGGSGRCAGRVRGLPRPALTPGRRGGGRVGGAGQNHERLRAALALGGTASAAQAGGGRRSRPGRPDLARAARTGAGRDRPARRARSCFEGQRARAGRTRAQAPSAWRTGPRLRQRAVGGARTRSASNSVTPIAEAGSGGGRRRAALCWAWAKR